MERGTCFGRQMERANKVSFFAQTDRPEQLSNACLFHREDLTTVLAKAGATLTVPLLLESLQQTTDFEAFLGKKFGVSVCQLFSDPYLN